MLTKCQRNEGRTKGREEGRLDGGPEGVVLRSRQVQQNKVFGANIGEHVL